MPFMLSAAAEARAPAPTIFQCALDRGVLLKALTHAQGVVERRNTVPILANILLTATASGLSLTATDMDLDCVERLDALAPAEGAATLPVHMLYDIVRKLPDGAAVTITAADGRASLSAGRSQFSLHCLPVEDFPIISQEQYPHTFTLPSAELRGLFDRTRFAMSTEETRYFLNGLYLHARDGQLVVVATDGHRLAKASAPLPEGAAEIPGVIVPRKTVTEVVKLLDEADEQVTIGLSPTKICFRLGTLNLTSKLIDGTYPDYSKVIPTRNDKNLIVNTSALSSAVDRVATVSSEKTRAVKLHVRRDGITVAASSQDASQGTDEVEATFTGEPLAIGFNARYLMDVFSQISSTDCTFQVADAASPTIVVNTDDDSALYVLMPMRI
jgi:DNA polymerase III subunit beta